MCLGAFHTLSQQLHVDHFLSFVSLSKFRTFCVSSSPKPTLLQIYIAMSIWASLNFAFLDRSKTGLILGTLLAVGAPLAEAVIVSFGLWHYERQDSKSLEG